VVERAWQDSDQICFILQGLKVSIPQSKVSRIESDTNHPEKSAASENKFNTGTIESDPQPAVEFLPNQIKITAETVSTAQPQSPPPGKALVLRQDGFSDLKWGARLAAVRGLEKRQTDSGLEDVIEYVRPADVLKLGDAELTTVVYAFWRDQLYTVSIWIQGPANYKALRDAVFKQFGKGMQIESAGEKYLWSDSLTDAMLKYETDDQYGMLWLRSKDLDRKLKLTELSSPTSYLKWMKSRK
ncbi:MAG: hypothetical protein JSW26_06400, partial [Desulfobacterales bacterium]